MGHAILEHRKIQDRTRSAESEVARRHEKALACEAETAHAAVVAAFRKEVEEATSRNSILELKTIDVDNRRTAMGSRVPELTKAESAMGARCQTLQVQHDEVVERGNRESVVMERAMSETIDRPSPKGSENGRG